MTRHPENTNLTLYSGNSYNGLPIQIEKGPFIREYLYRLYQTCNRALSQYPRTFAFRVDLRLPAGMYRPEYDYSNVVIDRFIESFKSKIKHNRRMACLKYKYAHSSKVRFVWARELGQHERPHYHMAILLNHDAFCSLGNFTSDKDNMFHRLQEAWASALNLPVDMVQGLVEVPRNPSYHLHRDDLDSQAEFFFRASYLCKAATKIYGNGGHVFGASRI